MSNENYTANGAPEHQLIEQYADLSAKLVELHRETKRPVGRDWQKRPGLDVETAINLLENGGSIGIQAGPVSDWLCCVDCDTDEAVKLAPKFLIKTLRSGKNGIPSHYVCYSEGLNYLKFSDLGQTEIVCIKAASRGQGHQFVVPPSVHPTKGAYEWIDGFDPDRIARVDKEQLEKSVRHLAAASLIAEYLPDRGRHEYSLALAGFLLNRGVEKSTVTRILKAAWWCKDAPQEGIGAVERNIEDTESRLDHGDHVIGGGRLDELVDGLPKKLAKFLNLNTGSGRGDHHSRSFRLTDLGNAERLVARHGDDIRYCHLWKKWFVWDGARWEIDDSGKIDRLAVDTVASIYAEAESAPNDSQRRKDIAKHAMASESRTRIEAMIALARSRPGVPVSPADLDQDRMLLNAENGTIDLTTGEIREHRRSDLITKLVGAPYDPSAAAPRFKTFLSEIFESDQDLISFVRRFAGYSATGSTQERAIAILHGRGKNGKTTLIELLQAALGDYARTTETETLLAQRHRSVSNDVAALKGARFVSAAEVEQGRELSESKVKKLTGNDTVNARFLFSEFFDFKPEFSLWLSTNNKPVIKGTDDAIWDRIKLVPFERRFEADEDTNLPETLRKELSGVLAWIIEGCAEWRRSGLGGAKKVSDATKSYRTEMDVIALFVEEECITDPPTVWCKFADLYNAYTQWCDRSNETPEKKIGFAKRLTESGYKPDTITGNVKIRRGIALRHRGGDDPSKVTDPPPDPEENPTEPPPSDESSSKNGNSELPKYQNGNSQNTCKTALSDKELPFVTENPISSQENVSRIEESGKTVTNGNSVTLDGESASREHVTSDAGVGHAGEYLRANLNPNTTVGFDIETTHRSPHEGTVRLCQISLPNITFIIDCASADPTPALRALVESGATVVAHNAAFEFAFILQHFDATLKNVADTMLLSRILYAGDKSAHHGLADVVGRELGETLDKTEQTSDWSAPDLTDSQLDYAARDAEVLPTLYEALSRKISEADLDEVSDLEHRALPFLARMTLAGVPFDREAWSELAEKARAEVERIDAALIKIVPPRLPEKRDGWNLGSPKQVRELLEVCGLDLPDGSTSEKVLKGFAEDTLESSGKRVAKAVLDFRKAKRANDIAGMENARNVVEDTAPEPTAPPAKPWNFGSPKQVTEAAGILGFDLDSGTDYLALIRHAEEQEFFRLMIERRKAAKLASSYAEGWIEKGLYKSGRLYPSWHQIGAASGRMSCSNPNLQQMPNDERYRSCVRAGAGKKLLHFDYSQIELRIAAIVAPDGAFIHTFRKGSEDVHTETAKLITGKKTVTKEERSKAKAVNFGLLYGMTARSLPEYALKNYSVTMTPQEAHRFYTKFFKLHSGLKKWHDKVHAEFDKSGQSIDASTMYGRRRSSIPVLNEALNHPVQGTGADGLKLAMAMLEERRDELPASLTPILAVHDELVFEVDESDAEDAYKPVEAIMQEAMNIVVNESRDDGRDVPIEVDGGIDERWA